MVERKANAIPRPSKDALMAAAEAAWAEIPEDIVRASCASTIKRLKGVVCAKGGHIE